MSVDFPYLMVMPFSETIQWKTDVISAYAAEQRIAIRMVPRTIYDCTFALTEQEFAEVKVLLDTWATGPFAVPVGAEGTDVGDISASASFILLDTSNADYFDGGSAAVIAGDDTYIVEIDTVASDRINLTAGFPDSVTDATVYPAKIGHFYEGFQFSRGVAVTFATGKFITTTGVDLSDTLTYDTFNSLPVLTDASYTLGGINERIVRSVDLFDNGSGPIESDTSSDYISRTFTLGFVKYSRAERWALREFLHTVKGRRGTFWLPSWNEDLILIADITSGTATLDVEDINYADYGDELDIMISLKSGTRVYNHVESGAKITGGERLTCSSNFGSNISASDVDRISFMRKCRLDADNPVFDFETPDLISCTVPAREVPE